MTLARKVLRHMADGELHTAESLTRATQADKAQIYNLITLQRNGGRIVVVSHALPKTYRITARGLEIAARKLTAELRNREPQETTVQRAIRTQPKSVWGLAA